MVGSAPKILLLNLPPPPNQRLWRDTAGGFGTAVTYLSKFSKNAETPFHLFFPYASAALSKAGFEFKILDAQKLGLNDSQLLKEIEKETPEFIVSIISLPSFKNDIKLLNRIKEFLQNVRIICVGTVCRVIPSEVLRQGKIDVVLRDSYPYTYNLANLIQSMQQSKRLNFVGNISYKLNGKIVHTQDVPVPHINDLPAPFYDFIKFDGYETVEDLTGARYLYVPILESKGCPYNCIYCPYPVGFGRKIEFKSPKAIVDEIEYLRYAYNVKGFLLRGQTFAYNRKRAIEICEEIIRRKLDIVWFCESRVDEVSKDLLMKMRKAGCIRIHYGVETGDPEILKIGKPGVRLINTEKAFKVTKELDILTQAHIILGWPEDNHQTLENTRKFILKIDPDALNVNFLTPYPGTKIYEIARENNLILTYDWSNYTSHTIVMRTKNLCADEIYAFRNNIVRDFVKRKLQQLFLTKDGLLTFKKPQVFIGKVRGLVDRILFPY
jgi:radical SAM superfamily enzyme YgiQ (UPF0313 family)